MSVKHFMAVFLLKCVPHGGEIKKVSETFDLLVALRDSSSRDHGCIIANPSMEIFQSRS